MPTITVIVGSSVKQCSWYLYNGNGTLNSSGQILSGGNKSWTMASVAPYVVLSAQPADGYETPIYYSRTDGYLQNLDEDNTLTFGHDKTGTLTATAKPTQTYTLSFGPGATDARGSMEPRTGKTTYVVPGCDYWRPGYDFTHWGYTDDDGYPQTINVGSKITLTRNLTLYAQWSKKTRITISFISKGVLVDEQTIDAGDGIFISGLDDTETEKFDYWYEVLSDGSWAVYYDGDSASFSKDTTLYAAWTTITYTITYNGNNATSGSTAKQEGSSTYTIRQNGFQRTGYAFQYWTYSDEYDQEHIYRPGDQVTPKRNMTLYAFWLRAYDVTYNTAGGDGGPSEGQKIINQAYTIPSVTPTKTGYIFAYWVDNLESGKHWNPGDSYTTNSNVTFTAIWTARTYSVQFRDNGGSGAPADQKKVYGVDLTLSTVKPTKTDSVFVGWGLSSSATTVTYYPGDTYTTNAGIVLYAVWTAKTKFYWHGSNAEDAKYFKVGARIDLAVTASAWNELCDYINDVRTLVGLSEAASSKVKVQAGEAFSAAKFNNVRNAIYDIVLKGYGSHVPSTVSKGQEITTALFNGADGLKAAINSCMDDL